MWRERFGRVILAALGAMLIGFGLLGLVAPAGLLTLSDIRLETPNAYATVRANYGGRNLGLGIFLLAAAVTPGLHRAGLLVALALVGGLVLGRLVGMPFEVTSNGFGWRMFVAQALFVVAVLLALTGRR